MSGGERERPEWEQERPDWCPHSDCRFLVRSQDSVCIGEMPEPRMHGGIENTHRMCQRGAPDDGSWLHAVEWNRGDAWNLWRCLNAVWGFTPTRPKESRDE